MPGVTRTKQEEDEEYQSTLDKIDKGQVKQGTMKDARRVPPQQKGLSRPRVGGFNIGRVFDRKGP